MVRLCLLWTKKKEIIKKEIEKTIGIDLGVINYTADSDGRKVEHPHFLNKSLKKLRREQKRLVKKEIKSKNREKQRIKLAKVYEKLVNQRNDFLHKLSRKYVNDYEFIAVERLNVRGLIRTSYNAKNIMDSSWNKFIKFLSYKADRAGKIVVKVNPRGTTKNCSRCGKEVDKNLAIRTHRCPFCGLKIDRDINSAINILKLGLENYRRNYGKSSLLEIKPLLERASLSVNQETLSFRLG